MDAQLVSSTGPVTLQSSIEAQRFPYLSCQAFARLGGIPTSLRTLHPVALHSHTCHLVFCIITLGASKEPLHHPWAEETSSNPHRISPKLARVLSPFTTTEQIMSSILEKIKDVVNPGAKHEGELLLTYYRIDPSKPYQ